MKVCGCFGVLLTLCALAAASAQNTNPCSASGSTSTARSCRITVAIANGGSFALPKLGELSIGSTTSNLTPPSASPPSDPSHIWYDSSYSRETTGFAVTVNANSTWNLTATANVASSPAHWTATNDATYGPPTGSASTTAWTSKPSSHFEISATSGSGYAGVPTNLTPLSVLSGQAAGSKSLQLWFETVFLYAFDTPGQYTLPVYITLTLP